MRLSRADHGSASIEKRIAIDVFCGVGGMSLGFEEAGFSVVAAVDVSRINVATHSRNFPTAKTICCDVRKLSGESIRSAASLGNADIDVVFGGAPCQGFSVGGKQQVNDPRNALLLEFGRLVSELRPKYFVLENVGGMLACRYAELFSRFTTMVRSAGYTILEPLTRLDAADFGVPQRRKRIFVIGWRQGETAPSYPKRKGRRVSVGEAIDDLKIANRARLVDDDTYDGPLGKASPYSSKLRRFRRGSRAKVITGFARTAHSALVVERFSRVRQGGVDPTSRFIRLERKGVAPTLRAGTGSDNGRFMAPRPIHPDYPRCITVREAARLHSFPDWFVFHHTKWNGFMQIGNSVPPMLAKAVAREIAKSLERKRNAAPAVDGNHFTPHGDGQIHRYGSRAVGAVDGLRDGCEVPPEEPRSARFARPRKQD